MIRLFAKIQYKKEFLLIHFRFISFSFEKNVIFFVSDAKEIKIGKNEANKKKTQKH